MSTFLQTLAVVVISIAAATALAVKDPEQPATLREKRRRERNPRHAATKAPRPRRERAPRPPRLGPHVEPAAVTRPLRVPANVEVGGFSDHWVPAPVGPTIWLRVRSGMVLTVLLAMIGTLVAISIGGVIVFIALALRSAVS